MKTIATLAAAALPHSTRAANNSPLLANMGIASTSFMGAALGKRSSAGHSGSAMSLPPAQGNSTVDFLERCHKFGAKGVQTQLRGDPHQIRSRAEELGMWVEAMISVRNSTPESLEAAIRNAKEAGCTIARDGLLGGRRYETFNTLADWNAWVEVSKQKIAMAVPILEKQKFTLALENHKDWTLEEYVKIFETHQSEYFGACLDFGNNISLLDDLMAVIETIAPYTKATHFKDMAVAPYNDGFLLSEVPLGTGVLDLPRTLHILEKANPQVHLSLEMITRDPLKVPCLDDHYWVTFPDRNGIFLARTLRFVEQHKSSTPLPQPEELSHEEHARVEEDNIRKCFDWARAQQT
ncbi:MAG TPA: TIM barrel protein [Bryobacteraceae bacterium]|nr:TIM barrel protein [Bryobacteraceae bacterium]